MPLIKREVEPILVSRVDIAKGISNELECVTNYTLASIIRQLSNLGKHAEDIFGELYKEALGLSQRANSMQDRIDKLSEKVTKLDATRDQVSLQDIHMRKAFKSSLALDTEVVASPTMPSAMRETYMRCEKPPKLSLLNQFREDGKDGLKFYTDPKFFFERWCNEQQKDIQNNLKKRKRRKKPKHNEEKGQQPRVPINSRRARYQMYAQGVELVDRRPISQNIAGSHVSSRDINSDPTRPQMSPSDSFISSTPSEDSGINGQSQRHRPSNRPPPPPSQQLTPVESPVNGDVVLRPSRPAPVRPPTGCTSIANHVSPTIPPPPNVPQQDYINSDNSMYSSIGSMDLPPPPLSPESMMINHAQPLPVPNNIPTPPPPPPLGSGPAPPPPVPNSNIPVPPPPPGQAPIQQPTTSQTPSGTNSPVVNSPNRPSLVQASDPRSDLLTAIQRGMQLRKVEVQEEKQRRSEPATNSVEAILRRRIAVELSSDEDDSQTSSDVDDWEDDD